MSSGKRSLLDLLPEPKQRTGKLPVKKPKTGERKEAERKIPVADNNERYRVNSSYTEAAEPTSQPPPSQHDDNALIWKAFEEEQNMARKSNKPTYLEFKEINQDDLRSGISSSQRESDAIGLALAVDPDEDDKVVLPGYTLSKEAHQKHQITTLYTNMKKNETKLLTKEAASAKTKKETQKKYGW